MTISEFNQLSNEDAATLLATCCGSAKWKAEMMKSFPFADEDEMTRHATTCWYDKCDEKDWLDAFTHHPKIGDIKSITDKFASTKHLASNEQAGVNEAPLAVIQEMALLNAAYEKKFGFIFIVCATGKPAVEMLQLLKERLQNDPAKELQIAMGEQAKITGLRLQKLIESND